MTVTARVRSKGAAAIRRTEMALARDARSALLARRRRARLAPRKVEYRWQLDGEAPHEVMARLAEIGERQVDKEFRVAPLDPQAPGKLGRPMGFLALVDPQLELVRLGMRAGEGRQVFAPVLELEVRAQGERTHVRGTIKREWPDSVLGLLGVGMLTLGFGFAVGLVLLFAGMFVAGGAAMAVGIGMFASAYAVSSIALRTVNTRMVHEALVNRAKQALEGSERRGYRE